MVNEEVTDTRIFYSIIVSIQYWDSMSNHKLNLVTKADSLTEATKNAEEYFKNYRATVINIKIVVLDGEI